MYHPFVIANFFIRRADKENIELTPMKLLKLVYIAHGWYLGFNDNKLINEPVEAWRYGPVITSLYYKLKSFGSNQVDALIIPPPGEKNEIDNKTQEFLGLVWTAYKKFNALQLSTLTHLKDTPWAKTDQSYYIDEEVIKKYYKKKIEENKAAVEKERKKETA